MSSPKSDFSKKIRFYENVNWFLANKEVLFTLLFLLYKVFSRISPGVLFTLACNTSIPFLHGCCSFSWNASFSLYTLLVLHLVMEMEIREYIWGTFSRSQIHLHEALVYFVIQSIYLFLLVCSCITAWQILSWIAVIFFGCLSPSLPISFNLIHHSFRVLYWVLGTYSLFRSRRPLNCWIEFSFCALSWNVLWIITSLQFLETSSLYHSLWVQQEMRV